MARDVNGSSIALPENARLTSSTPPCAAATAGQVVLGRFYDTPKTTGQVMHEFKHGELKAVLAAREAR